MYSRVYSLKTRYNFRKVLGSTGIYNSKSLVVKYVKADSIKFGIIVSNKFSKKAVTQNRVRRIIAEVINSRIEKFPKNYYFVFIPKRAVLDGDGKIKIDVQTVGSEIDPFLSKVDFS